MKLTPLGLKAAYDNAATKCGPDLREFARIHDLYSGESPYDETALREAGRAEMSNINTRGFKLNVVNKLNRWKELASGKPQIQVAFKKHPSPPDRVADAERLAHILTDEVLLNAHFLSLRFARYLDTIRYGSGVLVFDDEDAIFPSHLMRSALVTDLDAPMNPVEWDRAFYRATFSVPKLFSIAAGGVRGWDQKALGALLSSHAEGYKGKTAEQALAVSEWEAVSIQMGQAVSDGSYDAASIPVIVGYFYDAEKQVVVKRIAADLTLPQVDREGRVTGALSPTGERFLFEAEIPGAKTLADVFAMMAYTEEEGKLWRQRGYGHDTYDIMVAQLRIENNALDNVDIAKPVLTTDGAITGGSQNVRVDRFIHAPPGSSMSSDLMKLDPSIPLAMGARLGQQAEALAKTTPAPSALEQASKQPISAAEARARMSSSSEQEIAEAKAVYRQDEALLRAVCLRVLKKRKSDQFTKHGALHEIVADRLDTELVFPGEVKAENLTIKILPGVGHGSTQDRQQRLQAAFSSRGALNPIGRERLNEDFFAELLGSDRVGRYVTKIDPRQVPVKEGHDARQENLFFEMGKSPVPAADDNHLLHAQVHMMYLLERAQAVAQAEQQQQTFDAAPLAVLFEASLPHLAFHIDQIGLAANTEELQAEHKGLMAGLANMNGMAQRLKANAQSQAEARQKQQQQAMQQQQQLQQQMMQRIDSQALTIQKMQADHTIAFEKFRAAQDVRERESMAKIERANRELEVKIRKMENER